MITEEDRLLILAPHPDDESLGAAGLIQRAQRAGAAVRILFVTDGDDNPWPQRFVERRLTLNQTARSRWGHRRREEARAAMARLGLQKSAALFLGLPDQGLTELLLSATESVVRALSHEVARWRPTLVLVPSGADTHPDHSALFVLAQLAIARQEIPPRQLRYLVHFPPRHSEKKALTMCLSADEVSTKRAAILCHASQVVLSRRRFLSYAKKHEIFYAAQAPRKIEAHHPVAAGSVSRGALRLTLRLCGPRATFAGGTLFVAFESLIEGSVRWSLVLPARSGKVLIENAATGEILRTAVVRIRRRTAQLALPVSALRPLRQIFVKLQWRRIFFDDAGWRELHADQAVEPIFAARENIDEPPRDGIVPAWKIHKEPARATA